MTLPRTPPTSAQPPRIEPLVSFNLDDDAEVSLNTFGVDGNNPDATPGQDPSQLSTLDYQSLYLEAIRKVNDARDQADAAREQNLALVKAIDALTKKLTSSEPSFKSSLKP